MPESTPEFVAAASLSPLSPTPISTSSAIRNTVVPKLQAATAGEETLDFPITPSAAHHHHPVTMDPNLETAEISDTIVVGGDYSDGSQDDSDGSIDYGEGEEGQDQEQVESRAANDDYARTFDSPAAHEDQSEASEAEPDVSVASKSMNSPPAPDPLTSQSPAAAVPSEHPSPPPPPGLPTTHGSVQVPVALSSVEQAHGSDNPSENPSETPSEPPSAATSTSPSSTAPDAPSVSPPPAEQTPAVLAPDPDQVVAAGPASAPASGDDAAVDIQKLVDDITARAAATASPPNAPAQTPPAPSQAAPAPLSVSHPPSLPPKPSLPNPPPGLPAIPPAPLSFQSRGPNGSVTVASPRASQGAYVPKDGISSLPHPPPSAFAGPSQPHTPHLPHTGDVSSANYHSMSFKQLWEQFQADEKRYTSEAKWERFPEGSRIFIGNLSSERVTKRQVFEVFHRFGRLAQISLKSAYGFVQYHTVAEGEAAMQGAQGIELGGRRIHLEVSRAQKKKDERDRSPERRSSRGGRGDDRFDAGDHGWRRDGYRPGRSPSPRRNDSRIGRDGHHPRDREFGGHARRRSRSPARFNRYGDDSYRRRSPSPHRRAPSDGDRFDLPRRFGPEVPDVQILLLQEVSRDFVGWVQGAFHSKGLRTDVMYLNPRFPRETVVQRQVVEGVHAIVDLDYGAQAKGKIPIQVFIRSGGSSVRFELYEDLDPSVAAELAVREKSQSGPQLAQPLPPYAAANPYGVQPPPAQAPASAYPYPYQQPPAAPALPTQPAAADLASVVGKLDNSALQALLASLQSAQPGAVAPVHSVLPQTGAHSGAPPVDVNAILGSLMHTAPAQPAPAPVPASVPGVPSYAAAPPAYIPPVGGAAPAAVAAGYGGVDTAQQVQTIIDQLKRAAQ